MKIYRIPGLTETMSAKRTRQRRAPLKRTKPGEIKPAATKDTPPEKLVVRAGFAILFLLITIFLVARSPDRLGVRVGDHTTKEFRARVPFEVINQEATREQRRIAAARAPRVFRDSSQEAMTLAGRIVNFLGLVQMSDSVAHLARTAGDTWGLTRGDLELLQEGLAKIELDVIESSIMQAFETIALQRHIWTEEDRREELEGGRFYIKIYDPKTDSYVDRSILDIHWMPGDVRRAFRREMSSLLEDNVLPEGFQDVLLAMLTARLQPTIVRDHVRSEQLMEQARQQVQAKYKRFEEGELIVGQGEPVSEQVLRELTQEQAAYYEAHPPSAFQRIARLGGIVMAVLLLYATAGAYFTRFRNDIMRSNTFFVRIGAVCVGILLLARIILWAGLSGLFIPLSFAGIILATAGGHGLGLGLSTMMAILTGIMVGGRFDIASILLLGAAAGIVTIRNPRKRTDLFKVGLVIGIVQAIAVWAFALLDIGFGGTLKAITVNSIEALLNGVGVGVLMTVFMPYIERAMNVVTDMSLMEWSDQNHPLLRKLALEAPGTYHHSIVVGNLAEAAAESIGANGLLARASALLHDVGKLIRPEYFVENTGADSPSKHDVLSPHMSCLIITAHPRDGVAIAEQYGVPKVIRNIIEEHHGTTVVEYFHNRALQCAENGKDVTESAFRYRGPLPRSRESGIILLADAVESASRVLQDPAPTRINELVREIVQRRLLDNQLDESTLTITETKKVQEAFSRTLTGILHRRIEYPG